MLKEKVREDSESIFYGVNYIKDTDHSRCQEVHSNHCSRADMVHMTYRTPCLSTSIAVR